MQYRNTFVPMHSSRFFIHVLLLVLIPTIVFSRDYNILDFGAIPDGATINTKFIQSAIDKAHEEGGGRVIIPAGRFLSGSIVLKSGVELHLLKKAILLGSTDPKDYRKLNRWLALVMADNADKIVVSGNGTIDGQGRPLALYIDSLFYAGEIDSADYKLREKRPAEPVRPQVIEFVNCTNARIEGVTIKNSASWVQSYFLCNGLVIDRIRVESDTYWNNDGIDIVNCKNVRITNSYFNSSDDGICLKSYIAGKAIPYCDSIYIANCTVRSSASAIKFGTGSYSGFKNVKIENIKVFDTFRSAVALESVDGGILENVIVDGVKAVNTGNAIFIRIGNRVEGRATGTLKNVVIRNVSVEVSSDPPDREYEIRGPELPFFHNVFPSSITGLPGHPVEDITLENIEIIYPGRGNKAFANMPLSRLSDVPENERDYPEFSMFGELPAWGFYIRHVNGLKMKNIQLKLKKADYRPAIVLDDVKNSTLQSVRVSGDEKEPVILNDSENVIIKE